MRRNVSWKRGGRRGEDELVVVRAGSDVSGPSDGVESVDGVVGGRGLVEEHLGLAVGDSWWRRASVGFAAMRHGARTQRIPQEGRVREEDLDEPTWRKGEVSALEDGKCERRTTLTGAQGEACRPRSSSAPRASAPHRTLRRPFRFLRPRTQTWRDGEPNQSTPEGRRRKRRTVGEVVSCSFGEGARQPHLVVGSPELVRVRSEPRAAKKGQLVVDEKAR